MLRPMQSPACSHPVSGSPQSCLTPLERTEPPASLFKAATRKLPSLALSPVWNPCGNQPQPGIWGYMAPRKEPQLCTSLRWAGASADLVVLAAAVVAVAAALRNGDVSKTLTWACWWKSSCWMTPEGSVCLLPKTENFGAGPQLIHMGTTSFVKGARKRMCPQPLDDW